MPYHLDLCQVYFIWCVSVHFLLQDQQEDDIFEWISKYCVFTLNEHKSQMKERPLMGVEWLKILIKLHISRQFLILCYNIHFYVANLILFYDFRDNGIIFSPVIRRFCIHTCLVVSCFFSAHSWKSLSSIYRKCSPTALQQTTHKNLLSFGITPTTSQKQQKGPIVNNIYFFIYCWQSDVNNIFLNSVYYYHIFQR